MAKIEFKAIIEKSDMGGAYVKFPFDVKDVFNKNGRIAVKATFDEVIYRGSLVKMGSDCHILGVLKDIMKQINKRIGDTVLVSVEEDLDERIVEIPVELNTLLENNPIAKEFFNSLSYTNKRLFCININDAKTEETRKKRLEKAISLLNNKEKFR